MSKSWVIKIKVWVLNVKHLCPQRQNFEILKSKMVNFCDWKDKVLKLQAIHFK